MKRERTKNEVNNKTCMNDMWQNELASEFLRGHLFYKCVRVLWLCAFEIKMCWMQRGITNEKHPQKMKKKNFWQLQSIKYHFEILCHSFESAVWSTSNIVHNIWNAQHFFDCCSLFLHLSSRECFSHIVQFHLGFE